MSDDLADELGRNIPLSEMIKTLRTELAVAMEAGQDEAIRFEAESVELELQVAVQSDKDGKISFGVVKFGGKSTTQAVHTFKLKLKPTYPKEKPTDSKEKGPLQLGGKERRLR